MGERMMTWVYDIIFTMFGKYRRYSLKMKIYLYRRLGAKIGTGIRLWGRLDGKSILARLG